MLHEFFAKWDVDECAETETEVGNDGTESKGFDSESVFVGRLVCVVLPFRETRC